MNQKANPDQQFEIGGKSYTLRFSVKAMAALQDHYQLGSVSEVLKHLSDMTNMSIDDFATLMWAGLQRHHPGMTKDEAMNVMDDLGLVGSQAIIAAAMYAGAPEDQAAGSKGPAEHPTNP